MTVGEDFPNQQERIRACLEQGLTIGRILNER